MSKKRHYYTEEEVAWLKENQDKMTRAKLAEAFNARFGASVDRSSISDKCAKDLKLHRSANTGRYGGRQKEQLQIGTIRKNQVGTYIKMQDSGNAHSTGYQEPYWMPLQKKIYQDAHGEIAHNQFVIFLDGNTENFDIDNLYPIDRKISVRMSQNDWWSKERESTLTAIKWCELYYAMKGDVPIAK